MENYSTNIAGINIGIESGNTNSSLVKKISHDLEATKTKNENNDIIISFHKKEFENYKPDIYSAKGSMNFNKNQFYVDYLSEISYIVENLFIDTNNTIVAINPDKKNIKKSLRQLFTVDKLETVKNSILSYSLFWYVFHIKLLQQKKAFIHAGIADTNGEATVIAGTGGCGKTSTLFKILEDENKNYIAEDFGIIDENANTYYNPKPVSIYASDMEFGQSILKNFYNNFSKKEKLLWTIKRKLLKRNPMIKAKPSKLMENRITKQSKIKNTIYFIRNNDSKISIKEIELQELVERTLDASMRELKTLNELLLLMHSNAPIEYSIPSFEKIRKQTEKIYKQCFSRTHNKILYIPHKSKPNEIVNFLHNEGIL